MNRALQRVVTAAFVAGLGVLATNAALTCRDIRALHGDGEWLAHTHKVIGELRKTLSKLKDAEINERDYRLTGQPEYLNAYHKSLEALRTKLDGVAALTRDNPGQQSEVKRLGDALAATAFCGQGADASPEPGDRTPAARTGLPPGVMEIVETTRQSIARMEREEQHLLTLRTSAHRSAADRAIASSLATTAVASGLLVASAALGRRLMPLAGATTPGLASTVRRLRPPGALRRRGRGESRCEANARVLDSDLGVLALIAVAVLGLCAVLLVVSRL